VGHRQKHSLSAVRYPPFADPAKSGAPRVVVASGEIKSMRRAAHPFAQNAKEWGTHNRGAVRKAKAKGGAARPLTPDPCL